MGSKTVGSAAGCRVFIAPNQRPTQLDPRAGPLPHPWRIFYGKKEERFEEEVDKDGNLRCIYFENSESGKIDYHDPRLTAQNLKNLGIELQDIFLV